MNNSLLEFKISLKRQFNEGLGILISLFIPIGIPIFYYLKHGKLTNGSEAIIIGFIIITPLILLALVPHLNYYFLNRNCVFTYDMESNIFYFSDGISKAEFRPKEISRIDFYCGYKIPGNAFFRWPWSDYEHAILYLRDGRSFILTSLVISAPELLQLGFHLEFHKNLYTSGFGLRHHI